MLLVRNLLLSFVITFTVGNAAVFTVHPQAAQQAQAPHSSTSIAHNIPAGSHFSRNWSGYIATGSNYYTGVGATWTLSPIPANPSKELEADATWVGIGGSKSDDLIQAGTQRVTADGDTYYQAWVELLPDYLATVPLTVNAGDSITTTIKEVGTNIWDVAITDNTTEKTYERVYSYASTHSSAEWVEEMPMRASGDLIGLDNFGSVTFTGVYALNNGVLSTASFLNAAPITLIDSSGLPMAVPSDLSSDTFTVSRDTIAL